MILQTVALIDGPRALEQLSGLAQFANCRQGEGLVHENVALAIRASCKLDLVLHCRVVAT